MDRGNEDRECKSVSLTKIKQTDPKQNFTHSSSSTNLEYYPLELVAENNNVYKTIMKKIYAFALRYKILKVQ